MPDSNFLSQATKNVGNFTLKEFASKDELDAYISSDKIGIDPEIEGVCFGFSVHEKSENKFELELFFNDMWPGWMQSIPNQK